MFRPHLDMSRDVCGLPGPNKNEADTKLTVVMCWHCIGWQMGEGGLTNNYNTDKSSLKSLILFLLYILLQLQKLKCIEGSKSTALGV